MAAPIVPKSEARITNNISVGYGEVPAVEIDGKTGWGLPGQAITYCRNEAKELAIKLDQTIRAAMQTSPRKSLI